jgi:wyosine [tRNA(Phe)-imidazoG37] synthetase (radical SAM superfamily)
MTNKVGTRIWCWMRCLCCSKPKVGETTVPNINKSVDDFYDTESVPSDN